MIKFGNYKKQGFKYSTNLNPRRNYVGYGALKAVMNSSGEIYIIDPPEPLIDNIQEYHFSGSSILSDKIQPTDKYNILLFKSKLDVIDFIGSHKSLHVPEIDDNYKLIDNYQYRLIVES